jgi:hypothetical protein
MRLIAPITDRLLNAIVPRMTAAAGCAPDPYTVACTACSYNKEARMWFQEQKTCHYSGTCALVCGPCNTIGGSHSICIS